MATEDIVRISYKDLENAVLEISMKHETSQPLWTNEPKTVTQKKSKSKRPAQQIYRPGQLKQIKSPRGQNESKEVHSGQENTEEDSDLVRAFSTSNYSRENSCDVCENDIQMRLDHLQICNQTCSSEENRPVNSPESSNEIQQDVSKRSVIERTSENKDDGSKRRSSKRPDMQVYIPRARLRDRENRSEEKEMSPSIFQCCDWVQETANKNEYNEEALFSGDEQPISPRLVQVKPKGGAMQVTVLNESMSQGETTHHSKHASVSTKYNEGSKERRNDKSFGQRERSGKGQYHQDTHSSSRSRGEDKKSDQPVRSYTRMRRSNSSDSRRSENDVANKQSKESDKGQFSSDTFPRAKLSGGKERKSQIRDIYISGKNNKESACKGRDGDKFYWGMRRQRTGSISSEASFVSNMESSGSFYSGSSDFYTEDDEPEHILDWGEEVEKAHLEELARLVHDGAQKLTSSLGVYPETGSEIVSRDALNEQKHLVADLNRQMSVSADRIYQINPKEKRHRRRHRHRKPPSQQSSRDSSVHSTAHSDNSAGGVRRRRRRRHSSQHSQQGDNGTEGEEVGPNMSGLQVTIGRRARHVELNKNKSANSSGAEGGEYKCHQHEDADWDGEKSIEFNRSDKFRKWQKEPSHKFHHDSDGRNSDTGCRRIRRETGRGREGERMRHSSETNLDEPWGIDKDWRHSDDQRLVHPAHDSSYSPSTKGRGRDKYRNEKRKGNIQMGQVNNDDFAITHKNQGRGLLHLPNREDPSRRQCTSSPSEYLSYHQQTNEVRPNRICNNRGSHPRGSGAGDRHLFDPDNPSKPITVFHSQHAELTFEDTDESHSHNFDSDRHNLLSPEGNHNHHGYLPSFYPPEYPTSYHFRPPVQFRPSGPFPVGGYPQQTISPMFYRFPRMPLPDLNFYNSGEGDEGCSVAGSRTQCRMMAEQILRDSVPFESQLGNILSRRPHSEDSYRMINQIRAELQHRLEQAILLDIEVANKQNVEQSLWKSVYYQVIESLRKQVSDEENNNISKQRLKEILDEGKRFFESLLKKLQSNYDFSLDYYTDRNGPVPDTPSRSIKLGLLSSQRIMMFLGDIARYREQLADTTNYGKARHWYLKAQKIHPRNGRPYNQLAILAVYTRRKLDAVYYYMRSLAASNPIMTARESLMSLFDEVRRKVDSIERKKFQERHRRLSLYRKQTSRSPRVEIWISPDGSSVQDSVEEDAEEDLSGLSPIELNKRFVLTYLNVHGKLFTKINFEMFAESSSLMLHEFATLIQHTPCVLSSTRLLQLVVINMFSIDNTTLKDSSLEESCRSLLQEHAVEIGLEMFGLLVQRCSQLLLTQLKKKTVDQSSCSAQDRYDSSSCSDLELCEDLHSVLPALKTWVEWMMCHAELWNPQPLNRPPGLGPHIDVWKNLAVFCDLLNKLETKQGCLIREEKPGYEQVILQEDTTLAGFVPMLSAPQETFYFPTCIDKRQAEDFLRIEKLRLFGEYLCGVEPAMLGYNVESGSYYSTAPSPARSEVTLDINAGINSSGDESEDVILEQNSDTGVESDEDDHIERLKAKRVELHRRKEERLRDKESMNAILDTHRQAKIELEIRPLFLIPDTNCFIDHFATLKKLLDTKKYTLVVPLVVINELDGLSRGARDKQYDSPDHAAMVKSSAAAAVHFLEDQFEAKNSHLRAQTSKGTVMETISFRSEEIDPNAGINDDTILSCCKHYCKDNARDFMPKEKDQPVRLYRDVVLLTEDRNLRLKAHASNVPVKDVIGFKKWSKIP